MKLSVAKIQQDKINEKSKFFQKQVNKEDYEFLFCFGWEADKKR